MATETELLVTLRDAFTDLAQKLARLIDEQEAADRTACWSLPPRAMPDDNARARRRDAAGEVPHRLK
jgi:hypothetical protein